MDGWMDGLVVGHSDIEMEIVSLYQLAFCFVEKTFKKLKYRTLIRTNNTSHS